MNSPFESAAPFASHAPERLDIAIVGGGLAGASLALALRRALGEDAAITIFDPAINRPAAGDERWSAIAAGARRLLTTIGVWDEVASSAEPMRSMVVTDSRLKDVARPSFLSFDGDVEPGEPFAYMMSNGVLQRALVEAARAAGVDMRAEAVESFTAHERHMDITTGSGQTLRTQLLVACDGARSRLRSLAGIETVKWAYDQSAITFAVEHERPHEGCAVEHFLPGGPFASLPMPENRSFIVWSERTTDAERLLAMPSFLFQEELEQRFGHKLGVVKVVTKPRAYPLGFSIARSFIAPRFALVGDAAHLIHPIAGQGLNMGLRDVAALAEVITDAARVGLDFAAPTTLERYQRWRRFDTVAMGVATDGLNRLFSNHSDALRAVRDIGLGIVDRMPRLKNMFIKDAAGLSGNVPRLLKGEAL